MKSNINESIKIKVIIFVDYFLPGYKGGGTIHAVVNLIKSLQNEIDFFVVTRDRDFSDKKQYPNIKLNEWNKIENYYVFYLPPNQPSIRFIKRIIIDLKPNIIYLNAIFSLRYTLYPLIVRKFNKNIKKIPYIIAPKGQLLNGALKLKRRIKSLVLIFTKFTFLFSNVKWHSTSLLETKGIKKTISKTAEIYFASELIEFKHYDDFKKKKEPGFLKIVFLSRISKKKNLHGALDILNSVKGNVQFNIYGPLEDLKYWNLCKRKISELPSNIRATYLGTVPNKKDEVLKTLSENHIYLLPTKGENFCYSALEALMVGLPVLISDRTPWRDLQIKKMGWAIEIDDYERFRQIIESCINWNNEEFSEWSNNAKIYGAKLIDEINDRDKSLNLFKSCLVSKNQIKYKE